MNEFVDLIEKYFDPNHKKPVSYFFEQVFENVEQASQLLDKYGIHTIEPIKYGRQNYGGFISDKLVLKVDMHSLINDDLLIKGIQHSYAEGANIGNIFKVIKKEKRYYVFESKVIGEDINLYAASHNERDIDCGFINATDEQIIKLIKDFKILNKNKVLFEYVGDNMKYDSELGFGMFDFERIKSEPNDFYSIYNLKKEQLLKSIELGRADISRDQAEDFMQRIRSLYHKYKTKTIGEINAELCLLSSTY